MQDLDDQSFTESDLDSLIQRNGVNEITNLNAAGLATMKRVFEKLKSLGGKEGILGTASIDRRYLEAFDKLYAQAQNLAVNQYTEQHKAVLIAIGEYQSYVIKLPGIDREHVFVGAPDPTKLRQGAAGDCAFLATVVSWVTSQLRFGANYRGPTVQSMIQELVNDANNDQVIDYWERTYKVSFPGGNVLTITPPTHAELLLYASAGDNGMWIGVLEKAYCYSRGNAFFTFRKFLGSDDLGQDNLKHGEVLFRSISTLTNNKSNWMMLGDPAKDTFLDKMVQPFGGSVQKIKDRKHILEAIDQALEQGRIVTTQTNVTFVDVDMPFNAGVKGNLVGPHAFAIIGSRDVGGAKRYELQNPWNQASPYGGKFEVDAAFLLRYFGVYSIQTYKPL